MAKVAHFELAWALRFSYSPVLQKIKCHLDKKLKRSLMINDVEIHQLFLLPVKFHRFICEKRRQNNFPHIS